MTLDPGVWFEATQSHHLDSTGVLSPLAPIGTDWGWQDLPEKEDLKAGVGTSQAAKRVLKGVTVREREPPGSQPASSERSSSSSQGGSWKTEEEVEG